jgi:hypothetical protein
MSLKATLNAIVAGEDQYAEQGFNLPRPSTTHFKNGESFKKAITEQAEAIAVLDAGCLDSVDIDGKVQGTDYRLSHAAFSDMCNFSGVPVAFIRRLAVLDETQAIDVLELCLKHVFHRGTAKSLVIDSRDGRIEGIVGTDTYSPLPNVDVIESVVASTPDLFISNGWIQGPRMRLTAISEQREEVRVDDIVRCGVSVENSLHGDKALVIRDYTERLVCTNGACAIDAEHIARIIHTGDVLFACQKALVESAHRSAEIIPLMRKAAEHMMSPPEIHAFGTFTKDVKNGGSDGLWSTVKQEVKRAALDEGRTMEEITLWNMTNAITQAAHGAPSLSRRTELEGMGYRALVKFGAVLLN